MRSKQRKRLFRMVCQLCKAEHDFYNPKQFSSWIRRHRSKVHSTLRGRLSFKPKLGPGVIGLVPAMSDREK